MPWACQHLSVSGVLRRLEVGGVNKERESSLLLHTPGNPCILPPRPPTNPGFVGKGRTNPEPKPIGANCILGWPWFNRAWLLCAGWAPLPLHQSWPLGVWSSLALAGCGPEVCWLLYQFISLTLLLEILTLELQNVSQMTKVSGLPGVCALGQNSTKCLISAICSEWI